jgi:hypothetical protein
MADKKAESPAAKFAAVAQEDKKAESPAEKFAKKAQEMTKVAAAKREEEQKAYENRLYDEFLLMCEKAAQAGQRSTKYEGGTLSERFLARLKDEGGFTVEQYEYDQADPRGPYDGYKISF